MARRVDLTGGNIARKNRKDRNYGTKTDLASTVVERGATHWTDGSNVAVDGILEVAGTSYFSGTTTISGALTIAGSTGITGPLTIQGVTDITGQLNVTGPTTLDGILDIGGDTTITGQLDVDGPTTISGTLDIDGVTTLNNDLNVTNSGEINVGTNMTLTPSNDGGSILFQDGSKVTSVGGTVQAKAAGAAAGGFTAGLNTATISAGQGFITIDNIGNWSWIGGAKFESNGTTVTMTANKTNLTSPLTETSSNLKVGGQAEIMGHLLYRGIPEASSSSFTPNMYIDGNGRVYRTPWIPA